MVRMGWDRAEAIPEIADIDGVDREEAGRRYDEAVRRSQRAKNAAIMRSVLISTAKEHARKGTINNRMADEYKTYRKAFFKELERLREGD
jgi:inorganic pyrophosphatase/exopolyphosphatase